MHCNQPSYCILPPILSRIRVHYVDSAYHVFSLQKIHTYLGSKQLTKKPLTTFEVTLFTVPPMESATLLLSFTRDPYLLLADADVIFWFVQASTTGKSPHSTYSLKRHAYP